MYKKYPLNHFLSLIQQPIAICDGGSPEFDLQRRINNFFEKELKIPFDHAKNLYRDLDLFDLSKYKTLAFATQEDYMSSKIEKIFDFDKSNLKCLIVQNKNSFQLVEDQAKELGITVIGFDREWYGTLWEESPDFPEAEYHHPFFDPFTEELHHMWH